MVYSGFDAQIADIAGQVASRFWGKYRGIVEEVNDPENMGRITAKVPSVYGDEVSPFALPAVPFAGDGHAFLFLPKKGDGVWIEFEGGDVARPIWSGFWWARNEMPSEAKPESRVLITPGGLKLIMDDDAKELKLLHGTQGEITISDSAITIRFGQTKVVLDSSGISLNNTSMKVM